MVIYKCYYTVQAQKDQEKIRKSKYKEIVKKLIDLIFEDPFVYPPAYKKLTGELSKYYSRRISLKHRLLYEVNTEDKKIIIHRMWSHYWDN